LHEFYYDILIDEKEYESLKNKLLAKKDTDNGKPFRAVLSGLTDGTEIDINCKDEVDEIKAQLEEASYSVVKVKIKKVNRQPAPPFITSTMQQEASRRFHFSAKQTMVTAQQLYEGLSVGDEGIVGGGDCDSVLGFEQAPVRRRQDGDFVGGPVERLGEGGGGCLGARDDRRRRHEQHHPE